MSTIEEVRADISDIQDVLDAKRELLSKLMSAETMQASSPLANNMESRSDNPQPYNETLHIQDPFSSCRQVQDPAFPSLPERRLSTLSDCEIDSERQINNLQNQMRRLQSEKEHLRDQLNMRTPRVSQANAEGVTVKGLIHEKTADIQSQLAFERSKREQLEVANDRYKREIFNLHSELKRYKEQNSLMYQKLGELSVQQQNSLEFNSERSHVFHGEGVRQRSATTTGSFDSFRNQNRRFSISTMSPSNAHQTLGIPASSPPDMYGNGLPVHDSSVQTGIKPFPEESLYPTAKCRSSRFSDTFETGTWSPMSGGSSMVTAEDKDFQFSVPDDPQPLPIGGPTSVITQLHETQM